MAKIKVLDCRRCGQDFSVPFGSGRNPYYCDGCRTPARNDKARNRLGYVGPVTRNCDRCGAEYTRGNPVGRYCSKFCRHRSDERKSADRRRNQKRSWKICANCGQKFEATGQQRHCSDQCRNSKRAASQAARWADYTPLPKNHRARAKRFKVAYDPTITRQAVLDRDGWMCQLGCEHPKIDPAAVYPAREYGSIDHIVAMFKGGGHVWGNVQAAHLGCNIDKGVG